MNISNLEEALSYTFKNKKLIELALIHRSFGNENQTFKKTSNEKLELLGDAVLDLIVTEYLYSNYPTHNEGELAKLKSMAISEPILSKVALKYNLGSYLKLSRGEELTGGRTRPSILGDAFEAILGAIYLDSDFITVREKALKMLIPFLKNVEADEDLIDYKTTLQEYIQKRFKGVPAYTTVEESGPDHKKLFIIEVSIGDKLLGRGRGRNKKLAEQAAAKCAYNKVKEK